MWCVQAASTLKSLSYKPSPSVLCWLGRASNCNESCACNAWLISSSGDAVPGVDFIDEDNGPEQQDIEEISEDIQAAEDEVAMDQDADQIRQVIESEESEEHPLKVLGEDMCAIGEKIILGIEDPFLGYSEAQIEQFIQKIAPTESNKRRTKRQLNLIFARD